MRARNLRPALLAALALLLLYAQPSAAHADEPLAPDETAGAGTIVTWLQPGWNMVGWIGPATPTSELFEEIPALEHVSAWDAGAQQYQRATRASSKELSTLTPGMGLWLHLGGNDAVRWTRPAAPDGLVLRLRRGLNFVGVVAGGAVSQPDTAASAAWRWDPARQQYELYRFGDATLRAGDALWVQASAPVIWWQPGTAEPPIAFFGDVPAEVQNDFRDEYREMRRFFAEQLGVAIRGTLHYIGSDPEALRQIHFAVFGDDIRQDFCGRSDHGGFHVVVLRCTTPPAGSLDWYYVDSLLFGITGSGLRWRGAPRLDPRGPGWLIEGTREYALALYREAANRSQVWYYWPPDVNARRTVLPFSHFELVQDRGSTLNASEDALGFFAVEWLAERVGKSAVFDYFRLMRTSTDWRAAFEAAFGISVDAFYQAFETYRAEVFPPLPHLSDDLTEPVLVFVEGIPSATQLTIKTEFENVRRFFASRFEAEATEFTLFVARDEETASGALTWVGDIFCRARPVYERVILTVQQCGTLPPLDAVYARAMVHELAPLSELRTAGISSTGDLAPRWFSDGATGYAEVAYRAAAGRLDLEQYRNVQIQRARSTPYSLREMATHDGAAVAGTRTTRGVGFLAVEWLVNHAGEPAVFEYYRVLPSSASREAAFESALGLTIDDFYEQFEAYRAELTAR